MSTLKTNNVQVGQSLTATNNFTLYQPSTPDGTVRLGVGNTGATTADVITANSSGNVGIGTSSPVSRLNVSVTDGGSVTISNTNDTHTGALNFGDTSSNTSGRISYDHSSNALRFDSNGSERARFDSSGYLLINRTSNSTSSYVQIYGAQPAMSCESTSTGSVNQVLFRNPNGQVGSIGTSGSSTSYNTSSDYRLKQDIAPMTGALTRVAALKPVTYKWKVDGSDGEGFIAHELQEVVPDCVTGEKDAVDANGNPVYQGIDTSFLVATLTAAIQELKAELDSVKAELATLKNG